MDISDLVQEITTELRHNFERRGRLISHPGERGDVSEIALREMLKTYLPGRCGVDRGFVVDSNWNESRQIDVVIYDKNHTPVFEIVNGKRYFPCETVLAVGEVKKSISDSNTLEDSFSKIESVKELDRAGAPIITGPGMNLVENKLEDDSYRDQIFGFIFTGESLKPENFIERYLKELNKRRPEVWPNYYCDYNNFNVGYDKWQDDHNKEDFTISELEDSSEFESDSKNLTYDPMTADGLYITYEHEILFGLFHSLLSQFVMEAHIGRPQLYSYYSIGSLDHGRITLERLQD